MSQYIALKDVNSSEYKKVWFIFDSDETLEEVQKRYAWDTTLEIINADNAPTGVENSWVYYLDTKTFAELKSTLPVNQQLYNLDRKYRNRIDRVCLDFIAAVMDGDTINQERLKTLKELIMKDYITKRTKIFENRV
jgi:hypothetical protein